MANVLEEYTSIESAIRRIIDLAADPTITISKIDLRLARSGYKLVATVYQNDESEEANDVSLS